MAVVVDRSENGLRMKCSCYITRFDFSVIEELGEENNGKVDDVVVVVGDAASWSY